MGRKSRQKKERQKGSTVEYTTYSDPDVWKREGLTATKLKEYYDLWVMQGLQMDWSKEYMEIKSLVELETEDMKKESAFKVGPEHIGKKLVCLDGSYGGWGSPKLIDYVIPLTVRNGVMEDQAVKYTGDNILYNYHADGDYWTPKVPTNKMHYNGNAKVWGFFEQEITEPIALRELTKENYGDTIRYNNESDRTIVFDSFETDSQTGAIYVRGTPILDSAGGFKQGAFMPTAPAFPKMAYYPYSDFARALDYSGNWWLVKKKGSTMEVEVNSQNEERDSDMSETQKSSSDSVVKGLAELIAPEIERRLAGTIDEKKVNQLIKKALDKDAKPKVLEIRNIDTQAVERIETPHKDLERLLYFVQKRHHVYLYGPAGSGKSTAADQIAQALKLPFGYLSLNPQTPDSRILGFIDAGGTYRKTPFYECYKNGGVFCIDEMDNASASLLTTLNSMLENGHGAFPGELVQRHKDFVLVATGNTNGRGANPMFPERRPFDVAFAERFTFLYWDYDTTLERRVTLSINPHAEPWLEWVRRAREYTAKNYPKVLVSPRASFKGAEYLLDGKMTALEIVESLVFKGLDKATIDKITSNCPLPSHTSMKAVK